MQMCGKFIVCLGEVKKFPVVWFPRLFCFHFFRASWVFPSWKLQKFRGCHSPVFACIDLSELWGSLSSPMLYKAYSFTVEPDFVVPPPSIYEPFHRWKSFWTVQCQVEMMRAKRELAKEKESYETLKACNEIWKIKIFLALGHTGCDPTAILFQERYGATCSATYCDLNVGTMRKSGVTIGIFTLLVQRERRAFKPAPEEARESSPCTSTPKFGRTAGAWHQVMP